MTMYNCSIINQEGDMTALVDSEDGVSITSHLQLLTSVLSLNNVDLCSMDHLSLSELEEFHFEVSAEIHTGVQCVS